MCGRYTLTVPAKLKALFPRYRFPSVTPRYNIAPTQPILALGNNAAGEAEMMLWGMAGNINARAETVTEKPSFRRAAREHRAIVFADGYYEWKTFGDGKQPYYIRRTDREPFTFAALWDEETLEIGTRVKTATLITTQARSSLAEIHHRMPVILSGQAREEWLSERPLDEDTIASMLRDGTYELEAFAVSLAVNRVANDTAALIEPVAPPEQPTLF